MSALPQSPPCAQQPIGVFDSGVGGLSVLAALRQELPHERFVYLADSGCAPYGEKGDAYVTARSLAIARWLLARHGIKALVVACNTATTAAVEALRAALPDLPVIGVEPALKPAAALTRTGHVGVLATQGTVHSARFARLRGAHEGQDVRFSVQACEGLAHAIEQSIAQTPAAAAAQAQVAALCARYVQGLGRFGSEPGAIDTLVLGCTHYVFAREQLRALVGPQVQLIDTAQAVARQTRRMLEAAHTLAPRAPGDEPADEPAPLLYTTGVLSALQAAAERWLGLAPQTCADLPEL